jgi:NADH-quinone oxidoreductase subunit K
VLSSPFIQLAILAGFIALAMYARKLASWAPKRLQPLVFAFIVLVAVAGLGYRLWSFLEQVGGTARFEPTLVNFLMLSFLLFVVGVAGVLTRRNIIIIFMSIELILNAVNLNLIAFSRYLELNRDVLAAKGLAINPLSGPVFTIFIIVVAAAEAAVGLGIVIAMFRNRETVAIDDIDLLKW